MTINNISIRYDGFRFSNSHIGRKRLKYTAFIDGVCVAWFIALNDAMAFAANYQS